MKQFWEQLTTSQKRSLTIGGIFVFAALLLQFGLFPLLDARQKVQASIRSNEKILRELAALGREYGELRLRSEEIKRVIERRPAGFALFSHLEKKATETGLKAHIKSINQLKPLSAGAFEETAVEMKIETLTIRQLVDFLYAVESPEQLVGIRRMTIGRMKENPDYLVAEIRVSALQKAQENTLKPSAEGR